MAKIDVVISGGSVEGLCTGAGFLKAITSDLKHEIVSAAGNSAGGVILGLYASGLHPDTIIEDILETDFSRFVSMPSWWELTKWTRFIRRGWLSDGNDFLIFLSQLTKGKLMRDAAFDLHIAGSDFTHYKLADINKVGWPEMPIALAMRITSCLPGAFKPVQYAGVLWFDGGVRRHYPVDLIPESNRLLCGWLVGSLENGSSGPVESRPGVFGLLGDYIDQAVDANTQDGIRLCRRPIKTVSYDDAYVGTHNFDIPRAEKQRLIDLARAKTVQGLK